MSCAALICTIGLHLVSYHWADGYDYNNANYGAYARTAEGWQAGIYRNSYRRTTVYAGKLWEWPLDGPDSPRIGVELGLGSGYERHPIMPLGGITLAWQGVRLSVVPRGGKTVAHLSIEAEIGK